jgi:hypothetical protein
MRGIRLQFEVKLLLAFAVVSLVVLLLGSGNLSFEEAKAKAFADRSSFSAGQLTKLEKFQTRFTESAFPPCRASTGMVPGNFTVIIEVGADGHVARSWRQGDSEFVICFQQLMTENFFFISRGQPFFTVFEYSNAS